MIARRKAHPLIAILFAAIYFVSARVLATMDLGLRRAHRFLEATLMAFSASRVGISTPKLLSNLARFSRRTSHALFQHGHLSRQQRANRPRDKDDNTAASIFESLSDDGPFRRLTDDEARRQVIFAYFYYGCLAAVLLAVLIWH